MSQVYSNAICNISAAASKDNSGGLFSNHGTIATRHVKASFSRYGGAPQMFTFCEPELWSDGVEQAPLNRRGWVLQERLLSCRNLQFGQYQLFWECREATACEMFPDAMPKSLLPNRQLSEETLKFLFTKLTNELGNCRTPLWDFRDFWARLVVFYSKCYLSRGTDKLVAFGGLVARIEKAFGGRYLAGMWWEDFVHQLCWRRESSPRPNHSRMENERLSSSWSSRQYIAPTWSWASCRYPVEQVFWIRRESDSTNDRTIILVDLVDAQIELVSTNPYGQVKDGCLVLQARLGTMMLAEEDVIVHHLAGFIPDPKWGGGDFEFFWDEPEEHSKIHQNVMLYILPIYTMESPKEGLCIEGLILRRSTDLATKFQRCGTFLTYSTETSNVILASCEHFDAISKDSSLDLETGESRKGWTCYMIKVI
jgi:hypothetical protein